MLVGFVCTEQLLNVIHLEHAMEYLTWAVIICQAFVAFESATHLVHLKERRSAAIAFAPLGHLGARAKAACAIGVGRCWMSLIASDPFAGLLCMHLTAADLFDRCCPRRLLCDCRL
jgi:hypothetical protein